MKDKFIKNYINNLTQNDIKMLANKNNINLNKNEIDYLLKIVKTKYNDIIYNPTPIFEELKKNISSDSYQKIVSLYFIYKNKYQSFL